MGDRGLGEKELFYDEIVRVPLIVVDPDRARRRHARRVRRALRRGRRHRADDPRRARPAGAGARVEGRSLLPLLRGETPPDWRDAAFARARLRLPPRAHGARPRRARMPRVDGAHAAQWKYVHWEGFRPQLFDLDADPLELDRWRARRLRRDCRRDAGAPVRHARGVEAPHSTARRRGGAPHRRPSPSTAFTSGSGDASRLSATCGLRRRHVDIGRSCAGCRARR